MKFPRSEVKQIFKRVRSNLKDGTADDTTDVLLEVQDWLAIKLAAPRPVKERPLPPGRPGDDMLWRLATWKVMRHMGYSDDEILQAEGENVHKDAGCEFDGQNWTCEDENGKSLHPAADELDSVAQILEIGLEFFRHDLPALMKH